MDGLLALTTYPRATYHLSVASGDPSKPGSLMDLIQALTPKLAITKESSTVLPSRIIKTRSHSITTPNSILMMHSLHSQTGQPNLKKLPPTTDTRMCMTHSLR